MLKIFAFVTVSFLALLLASQWSL